MGMLEFLGFKAKKKDPQGAPAQFLRPTRFQETEPGKLVFEQAKKRLAGVGTGIGQKFITGATAPFARQLRTAFEQRVVPRIGAAASARGLGRSTIPVGQIAQERAGVEQQVSTEVGRRQLENELLKISQKETATNRLSAIATQNVSAADIQAQLNKAEFERQEAVKDQNREAERAARAKVTALVAAAAGAAVGAAIPGVGAVAGAGLANVIVGSGSGGTADESDISIIKDIIERVLATQARKTEE